MQNYKYLLLFVLVGAPFFCAACDDNAFSSASDYQAVVTIKQGDNQYTYGNSLTYSLSDEVFDLIPDGEEDPTTAEHVYDEEILAAVARNMEDIGYSPVEDPTVETPDLLVSAYLVSILNFDYTGEFEFGPEENTTFKISNDVPDMMYEGDGVIVVIVDKSVTVDKNTYSPVWTAGVHNTYVHTSAESITLGIDQAFEQSGYLAAAGGEQ